MSYGEGMGNNLTKVPICLCVDTSSSMDGKPIQELNRGIELFFEELYNDEIARYSAEVLIIEFNSTAEISLPFTDVDSMSSMESNLQADGVTAMAEAVELAVSELSEKKREYKNSGISYYQPWLVLLSDGYPTDQNGYQSNNYKAIASRVKQLSSKREMLVIPIGIGPDANLSILSEFSATVPAQRLNNNNFKSFFKWLSASVKSQSRSNQDDNFSMDSTNLQWLVQKTG